MKSHVEAFSLQLEKALQIAAQAQLSKFNNIRQVLISGLGGSGIGGTVVAELVAEECKVPIIINKDYFIPGFVNEHTLVIISSYSGNTEETLSAIEQAIQKKAKIVCISSGGKISELARQHQLDLVTVPGGNPPRSCLGYSLVQIVNVLAHNNLIETDFRAHFQQSIHLLNSQSEAIKTEAYQLAERLADKVPVIYSLGSTEGIAVRFRQQINENSKMLCWHHVIPEMNHNELVGWTSSNEDLFVVILRTSFDYGRNIKRLEICKEVFKKYAGGMAEVVAKGQTKLEQAIYLIHLTDWVSCFIADIRQVDPIEIRVIEHLKTELAKV